MQNHCWKQFTSISAGVVLFAASALGFSHVAGSQASVSDADKSFVEAALKGGMGEVELGKMAAEKGASADVKQFGQMMATDHTKMGAKMKVVAGEIGVEPPTMNSASTIALKTELTVLSGDTFDKAYIKAMVKDHEEDLADFKKEVSEGTSPAVKKAASEGEAVISRHLAAIRKIAQAHNIEM